MSILNVGKTTSLIISGSAFLYLVAQSTKLISSRIKADAKTKSPDVQNKIKLKCGVCGSKKVEETKEELVACKICGALICQNKCSDGSLDDWECFNCTKNRVIQQKTGEWFIKQLTEFSTISFEMALGENISNLTKEKGNRIIISKVREIIEKCLVKILNGTDLDDTPIEKISDCAEYLHMFKKHHHVLTSLIFKLEKSIHISLIYDLPSASCINTDYVELKRFINRICQEVINLSDTIEFSNDSSVPKSSFDPQTYEELLATAVLNKITTDYLNKKKHGMSSLLGSKDSLSTAENEDFDSFDKIHLNKIQSHKISLPDLLNEFDEDISNGNHSGSWEDNWSMKHFVTDQKIAMLIPSPNVEVKAKIGDLDIDELSDSSEKDDFLYIDDALDESIEDEYNNNIDTRKVIEKVQICKDIEEVNQSLNENDMDTDFDISALASSRENIDEIFEEILMTKDESNESVRTKEVTYNMDDTKVDDKKESIFMEPSTTIEDESAIVTTEETIFKNINNTKVTEAQEPNYQHADENLAKIEEPNLNHLDDTTVADVEEPNVKYKSPLFTQYLVEPIKPIKMSDALKNTNLKADDVKIESIENASDPLVLDIKDEIYDPEDKSQNTPPIKGSIAEREHLKWLKAVPIENNPYSTEALQKRLSRTQEKYLDVHPEKQSDPVSDHFEDLRVKEDITKYKRDYYINSEFTAAQQKQIELINQNEPVKEFQNTPDDSNDNSLTVSDDSLTRIYTLSSQQTTFLRQSSSQPSKMMDEPERPEVSETIKEIDGEVLELPSVKKLAEFYAYSSKNLDSSVKNPDESMNIPVGISKKTSRKYEISDVPAKPIASITARTLPPKVKEDLRKSLLPTDQAIVRHGERNVSPDIKQGLTRNSIAYFETFYK